MAVSTAETSMRSFFPLHLHRDVEKTSKSSSALSAWKYSASVTSAMRLRVGSSRLRKLLPPKLPPPVVPKPLRPMRMASSSLPICSLEHISVAELVVPKPMV